MSDVDATETKETQRRCSAVRERAGGDSGDDGDD